MKRSNSQMRHKSSESKPRQREAGSEYFETIDSGWTSRDSSSMDRSGPSPQIEDIEQSLNWTNNRSSSVSLEEKMDELALAGTKMRKGGAMRQSELNLSQLGPASQQLVGFGMLPDQVELTDIISTTELFVASRLRCTARRSGKGLSSP